MKHLTVDEMIDFVSINNLNDGSLNLASAVNAHILRCEVCRRKVEAFQMVYDELVRMGKQKDFRGAAYRKVSEEKENGKKQLDGGR